MAVCPASATGSSLSADSEICVHTLDLVSNDHNSLTAFLPATPPNTIRESFDNNVYESQHWRFGFWRIIKTLMPGMRIISIMFVHISINGEKLIYWSLGNNWNTENKPKKNNKYTKKMLLFALYNRLLPTCSVLYSVIPLQCISKAAFLCAKLRSMNSHIPTHDRVRWIRVLKKSVARIFHGEVHASTIETK